MKFEFADNCTWGDLLRPGMEITDEKEAAEYFEATVQFGMRKHGQSREEATLWMKTNLGYFAGYYGSDVSARVQRLFRCTHPVFGNTIPTADEALAAGKKMARELL